MYRRFSSFRSLGEHLGNTVAVVGGGDSGGGLPGCPHMTDEMLMGSDDQVGVSFTPCRLSRLVPTHIGLHPRCHVTFERDAHAHGSPLFVFGGGFVSVFFAFVVACMYVPV